MENEVLNQEPVEVTNEVSSDAEDDFFSDVQFDEDGNIDTPVEEPVEVEEEQTEETVEETPVEENNEPFLNIRYNKEDIGLTREEAIELAQKGKNYDRINERYTSLSSELENLARMNGMEVREYLDRLSETQIQFEVEKELGALKEKFPDSDEEVLNMLAQQNVKEKLNIQKENRYRAEKEQSDAQDLEIQRQVENFQREYPDVNPENMPQEVIDDINSGNYTLLEAYNKWAIKEMRKNQPAIEAKQKSEKLNEENKKKSLGSTTNASGVEASDDFFSGLNSI